MELIILGAVGLIIIFLGIVGFITVILIKTPNETEKSDNSLPFSNKNREGVTNLITLTRGEEDAGVFNMVMEGENSLYKANEKIKELNESTIKQLLMKYFYRAGREGYSAEWIQYWLSFEMALIEYNVSSVREWDSIYSSDESNNIFEKMFSKSMKVFEKYEKEISTIAKKGRAERKNITKV